LVGLGRLQAKLCGQAVLAVLLANRKGSCRLIPLMSNEELFLKRRVMQLRGESVASRQRTRPSRVQGLLPAALRNAALPLITLACAAIAPVALAATPASLEGTAWVLADNEAVSLQFEQGRVSGSDGCNRFNGPYLSRGASLTIGPPLAATQMACPPPVMQQAARFNQALAATRFFRRDGANLRLLGTDGSVRATLVPQSKTLAGSWQVSAYNNGRQAVVSPLLGTVLDVSFLEGGRIAGSSGCNRYSAKIQVEGSQVAIAAPMSTRRLCSEPAGVMEQERQFLASLASVATLRHEGQRLELRRADGALAVIMQRLPTAAK
jgi:heat shock protein HslJ